jgi:hypothetical protein
LQLQPISDKQGAIKDNDLASLLSSRIVVVKHKENTTVERLDIIAATIPAKQK